MADELSPEQTLRRIRQIRTDAVLGKKKHYNAADRKQQYQDRIGLSVILINLIVGSGLFILLRAETAEVMKWLASILSLTAAVLAASQKYLGFQRIVDGHRSVANRYLDVSKRCTDLLAEYEDGLTIGPQLIKARNSISRALSEINSNAHSFPTSRADFEVARKGLSSGEEEYSDKDLEAGE